MSREETVQLKRDCEAIQIPFGTKQILKAGSSVRITQALGDSFTVVNEEGYLVKVAGKDADALGKQVAQAAAASAGTVDPVALEKMVWEQLRTCYDPEIPVNIADLGLIYSNKILPLPEEGYRVEIKMTLTAPGCGMGESIKSDAQGKILRLPGVKQANVELVWEPLWDRSMMSEAAKLQLGML